MSLKVLVSGDADGNISALFKRVETVNSKAGPFEMLLCVGSFFGPGNLGWSDYKSGRCKVPLPTYILGPTDPGQLICYPDLAGCELAENVIYLGRQGCFTTKEGLKIAYLSGLQAEDALTAKSHNYTAENLNSLEATLKWDSPRYLGVDILLTSDWPKGVTNNLPTKPAVDDLTVGSPLVSRLALLSRPRYHFCGAQGEHYERPPYRNHQAGSEQSRHVTRLIALAKVGNKEKKKWLYAFNISPMSSMEPRDLAAQIAGVTDMPYREQHITVSSAANNSNQFFYDMNAKMEEEGRGRKRKRDGDQPAPARPTGPCWFCLSSAEVEKHLIVSVGSHAYLALPKGGLTEDHLLICPVGHHSSQVTLPEEAADEVDKFKSALRKMYKRHNKVPVFFERNYKQQHLQIQVVPVPREAAGEVKKVFLDSASNLQLDLNEIPSHVPLSQLAVQGQAYLHVETPEKETLFGRIHKNFPLQFGREVLADEKLLDMAERVDWKSCSLGREEEVDMTKDMRKMFSSYDFTMELCTDCRLRYTATPMCRHCVRTPFPDRDRMCLESGAFLLNMAGCHNCSRNSLTTEQVQNTHIGSADSDSEDSDAECLENEGELVKYDHICSYCRHKVSTHKYKFWVEEGRQEYRMSCLLCGVGEDSLSVMPHDPRKASALEC